jgi:AMP-polyphosphate phosphotransferase
MFETAELGQKVSKAEYQRRELALREELLDAQFQLKDARFPVILLFHGVDGAGKGDTVNTLHEWMDTRLITTRAYDAPTTDEAERPLYWRYWRGLPTAGRVGIFLKAWYTDPFLRRVYGQTTPEEFEHALQRIRSFERTLAVDGAILLKVWLHLGKKHQKKAFEVLEADPHQAWRVSRQDWDHWKRYDDFIPVAERLITRTSTGRAPWQIVEGFDPRYRNLEVGAVLLKAIRRGLEEDRRRRERNSGAGEGTPVVGSHEDVDPEVQDRDGPAPLSGPPAGPTILSTLDMEKSLGKAGYREGLTRLQARLNALRRRARERNRSMVLVFEGWDAAGKGGAIRRVVRAMDARFYQVISVAAPTEEERAHHYLWRFWRYLPRDGRVTVFDRSWYGRVLVERIEGFATEAEWMRAYQEINDFEGELVSHGTVLAKFWIHITPEEQERRFKDRAGSSVKSWKLTEEDWRNRNRWDTYERAVHDMVERTSTRMAPWTLIEGDDKRYARVRVLEVVCEALEQSLGKD